MSKGSFRRDQDFEARIRLLDGEWNCSSKRGDRLWDYVRHKSNVPIIKECCWRINRLLEKRRGGDGGNHHDDHHQDIGEFECSFELPDRWQSKYCRDFNSFLDDRSNCGNSGSTLQMDLARNLVSFQVNLHQ